jgi:uncharacterized membrane protein
VIIKLMAKSEVSMRAMFKRFGGHFFYGMITLLPLFITFAILGWAVYQLNYFLGKHSWIGNVLGEFSKSIGFPHDLTLITSYVTVILFIALFGFLVRRYAKIRIGENIKKLFEHFPVVNVLYNTAEQVVGLVGKKDEHFGKFGEIAIIRYANVMVMAILAGREQIMINGKPHVLVFFPSTPVPATGFTFFVPIEDVFVTDLNFEQVTKIIISLGAMGPAVLQNGFKTEKL